MTILDVPYFLQISEDACGIAAFQMVYKYFRPSPLSKFSQEKVFRRLGVPDPLIRNRRRVNTDGIVALARSKGFHSDWGRISPLRAVLLRQVEQLIDSDRIPLIICQQSSLENPLQGHFRVVIGIEGNEVILHDPHPEIGGQSLRWPIEKLIDLWRYTGRNVTGGVTVWVAPEAIADPLDPKNPNQWN